MGPADVAALDAGADHGAAAPRGRGVVGVEAATMSSAHHIGPALVHMAAVLAEGDSRPGREPGDWLDGRISEEAQLAAIRRHLDRYEDGEESDADSGAHPLAHVMARCAMLITLDTTREE